MKRHRVAIWLVIVFVVLAVGALAGGVIVYATWSTSRGESPSRFAVDDPEAGIVVAGVAPDGPAAEAGLERGDILLELGGEPVNSSPQLRRLLAEREVGDEVELSVLHGDEERTLPVTLGERLGQPYLGLTPCGVLPELAIEPLPVVPRAAGTVVVRVLPDTPADRAGLEEGDRIVAVDGEEPDPENDLADLITAHEPGDTVTLEIERPGEEAREVSVQLGEHPEKEGTAYLGVEYRSLPRLEWLEEGHPFRGFPFDFNDEYFFEGPFVMPPDGELQEGAIIQRVAEDSPAELAGLGQGDVITSIDGEPLASPQDLVDAIAQMEPGDQVTLTVYDSDEEEGERQVEVTLAPHPEKEGEAYLGVVIGGFFRSWRSEKWESPNWMGPFRQFLDRFRFDRPFDDNFEFEFDWQPRELLDRLPFELDLHLPPELFEQAPCCSGDQAV